jgi:hypothetical protein
MSRNAFIRELHDMGWTVVRANKHIVWRHPKSPELMTTGATVSDHRATKNIMAVARRLLRRTATP